MKVHATPYSAGGIVLAGILLVIATLAWIASRGPGHTPTQFAVFTFLFLSVALYYVDAMSESLSLKNGIVIFNSLLRPKRRINACAMSEVTVVHEGFNQEPGMVTAVFHGADGKITRLPLGPMWRQTELSAFFSGLEGATGECRLVEDAR